MADFSIEPLAEDALLLRFGEGIDRGINAQVHLAADALRRANLSGILDIAPAYATLLVRFTPLAGSRDTHVQPWSGFAERLRAVLARADDRTHAGTAAANGDRRPVEIPVCYGGDRGPDLATVAEHANLTIDETIARHTGATYRVAMLGFAPGFPYLLGLDPALQVPRRTDPRTRVPAGSVAIGGAQTGIYPRELPGGWQLIGQTPLGLFDPDRDPPCRFAPGDRIRFRAIGNEEFERLREQPGAGWPPPARRSHGQPQPCTSR